jgi:hypothetical protein
LFTEDVVEELIAAAVVFTVDGEEIDWQQLELLAPGNTGRVFEK